MQMLWELSKIDSLVRPMIIEQLTKMFNLSKNAKKNKNHLPLSKSL